MRAVLQRVQQSWVDIDGKRVAKTDKGYNILLGVMEGDTQEDIKKLANKILNLRIFPNEDGKMDRNILQIGGEILVVSQFTLAANIKKGNRPDFTKAMRPQEAKKIYEAFVQYLQTFLTVQTGEFGAMMEVGIINDGPVTIVMDSKEL